ncbi:MAG: hypothetical protein MRZ38_01415, partial [Muribaculaceae bacterium]|nr:hypothetical protein [Muribaculaceae bacterium]
MAKLHEKASSTKQNRPNRPFFWHIITSPHKNASPYNLHGKAQHQLHTITIQVYSLNTTRSRNHKALS